MRLRFIAFVLPLLGAAIPASAEPVTKDHPLIKRYPGSEILGGSGSARQFDEYWMVLGRLYGDGQADSSRVLEGKWTHFTYSNPKNRSVLEIYNGYERALLKGGFEIVYSCKDAECGEGGRKTNGDWWPTGSLRRYMTAKLAQPKGDVWISLNVHARGPNAPGQHDLDIIETKPAKTEVELDEVAKLGQELTRAGRVAVYGIYFDAGKSEVKPESETALRDIARLVAQNPDLKLHVVGHSDNVGPVAASLKLSRQRAAAIVQALTRKHRVAAGQLHPEGVGPLVPLASNAAEEGRVKNRRVELVQQ